jgi:hypothetical protein
MCYQGVFSQVTYAMMLAEEAVKILEHVFG